MASLASNFARLSILRPSPPILGATLAVRHAVASTSTRGARVVGGRRQSYATISSPPSIFSIGNLKPLQPKKNVSAQLTLIIVLFCLVHLLTRLYMRLGRSRDWEEDRRLAEAGHRRGATRDKRPAPAMASRRQVSRVAKHR